MSWISKIVQRLFGGKEIEKSTIYSKDTIEFDEIHSIWDYLKLRDNTQAHHVTSVVGFEEWVTMEEIMRRIREIFKIDYKNDRSLYPYIKTLVDCGLFETSDVGGKRRWRKLDLIIKISKKKEEEAKKKEKLRAVQKTS